MLDALRFVQGAVARKDYNPALTHFCIRDGKIKGFNGALALCSPIALNLDVVPKATPFIKAIQACKDAVQISLTPTGRLSIRSGGFKAHIECLDQPYPDILPSGQEVQITSPILPYLKILAPFIAEDASRAWARGILFRGQSAFATNNVVLVEAWMPAVFPVEVNIPEMAILEILRINEEPERLQVADTAVTFWFPGGRWLRTSTLDTSWPDVGKILNRPCNPIPIGEEFYRALETIKPFLDDLERAYFLDGRIATSPEEVPAATIDCPGVPATGVFNLKQLLALEPAMTTIDFSMYPGPCLFFGDNLRGAITGMRG